MRTVRPLLALLALSACQADPLAPSVALSPDAPRTTDDLVASIATSEADVTYGWSWTRDGEPVADATTATVPSALTSKGEVWEASATPTAGKRVGMPGAASVTVLNTPPTVALAWQADPVTTLDDLVIVPTTADADADPVALSYTWTVDGAPVALTTDTINAIRTERGQVWAVTVTPNDGDEDGAPATTSITIRNSPPSIVEVTLAPDPAYTADTLFATALDLEDLDDDDVTLTYDWYVAGELAQSGPADTLDGSFFNKDERVWVVVTPNDGFDDGAPVTSAELLIANTHPQAPPRPVITPAGPGDDDALTCTIPSPAYDADDDPLTYRFQWTVDGTSHSTTTGAALTAVLPASSTSVGQTWTCDAVAIDDDGAESERSVVSAPARVRGASDGVVRKVDGTWIDVTFQECGSGSTGCTGEAARDACSAVGGKVVSRASNGSSTVASLGATTSCQWSISYFETFAEMPSDTCLVGISNLDWSSCCSTDQWHGNSVPFGAVGGIWGYVDVSNSGYVSSYSNVSGQTWGCNALSSPAPLRGGCSQGYVACTVE